MMYGITGEIRPVIKWIEDLVRSAFPGLKDDDVRIPEFLDVRGCHERYAEIVLLGIRRLEVSGDPETGYSLDYLRQRPLEEIAAYLRKEVLRILDEVAEATGAGAGAKI